MKLFNLFLEKLQKHRNPIQFWRSKGASIGDECEIYTSANLGSEPYLITIGNHVRINSGVEFVNHDGGVWVLRKYIKTSEAEKIDLFGTIHVGNNVHIGTNAIILPDVRIGDNCIIGCGAIVTKDIPNNSVAVGIPARVIETIDEYYVKNKCNIDYTKLMSNYEKKIYLTYKYKHSK